MRRVTSALLLVTLVLVTPAPAGAQRPVRAVTYRPPVAAPVVDWFRPPSTPYGSGNRGLEYATTPGTAVRSAAAGTVTFAGQVGGQLHVTLAHADGLRTTYAFLATVAVRAGQAVGPAEVVGLAGPRLVWTARLGDAYVDPAVLLAASGVPSVRLVPVTGSRPRTGPPRTSVTAAAARWALEGRVPRQVTSRG